MYTGSHLKLILAILLVPSIFIFLIAADSENRNFITDPELTVERISLEPVNVDIIEENNGVVSKPTLDNPGLSDENDFEAVAERQTIESDAERLKQNQEVYTIIQPTNVPRRPGTNIPNVVEYALITNNPLGVTIYERRFKSQARFERNCNRYVSDSSAQEAFLMAGGPERDQFGIDPDGDGYACRWDPSPFRKAVGN